MKRIMNLFIIIFLVITMGISMFYFNAIKKEPKSLIAMSRIIWERKDLFAQDSMALGLPIIWPTGLLINANCLYASDFCEGIQIFKFGFRGKLFATSYFDKSSKGVTIMYSTGQQLAVKGSYLYVADSGNSRIQVFKINPDGNIYPKFTFGKRGEGLGEFSSFMGGLAVKGSYLYVADSGNSRIQVFKIKY